MSPPQNFSQAQHTFHSKSFLWHLLCGYVNSDSTIEKTQVLNEVVVIRTIQSRSIVFLRESALVRFTDIAFNLIEG